jgi:hypothetical protein
MTESKQIGSEGPVKLINSTVPWPVSSTSLSEYNGDCARHESVLESGGTASPILNLDIIWR